MGAGVLGFLDFAPHRALQSPPSLPRPVRQARGLSPSTEAKANSCL